MRSPELSKLDYFVGTWHSEGKINPTPTSPGGKLTMTEHNEWMDGGFFLTLRSEFKSPMGTGSGMAYMGYDGARKLYTYDEFNSTGEAQHSTGKFDGDTWTWVGKQRLGEQHHGEPHPGGSANKTRFTMKIVSPTEYAFKFEMSPDGNSWSTIMDGNATKEK